MGKPVEVTTAIAQFMRDLERVWDQHRDALLVRRDLAAAVAPMADEPSVTHLPALTGGTGRQAVERFYAGQVLPYLPADLAGFHRMKIRSVRVLWDYATLLAQLGITAPVATAPVR